MSATVQQWLGMTREQLDDLYRRAEPGRIPNGDTRGTPIVAGSAFARAFATFARLFAWQGKVFDLFAEDGSAGVLVNKVTPLGLSFVVAKVYRAPSWMDGKDTIVIDYSRTSFFFRAVRDEIREIEPGVYLGKVWLGKTRVLDFALECQP
ncbi:hypothetical protein [Litchfieldella rifensis]|uniref:Uncharacterized protein n=1 Tax=Litchfieldella rifensis TaxID=762643 RepID=A0ABV7LKR7_9GAMM